MPSGAKSGENFELVAGFAANLATAFEAEGHLTQLISSQKLETYLGPGSGGDKLDDFFFREQVSQWLIDQEEVFTYQVMLADASSTSWTQLCIRQADCILCVADARDSPSLSEVENSLLFLKSKDGKIVGPQSPRRDSTVYTRQQARKELVLLHRGDPSTMRRPRNTRRWFKDRPSIREHHHVRWHVEVRGKKQPAAFSFCFYMLVVYYCALRLVLFLTELHFFIFYSHRMTFVESRVVCRDRLWASYLVEGDPEVWLIWA